MSKRKKNNGALLFGLVIAALATVGYGAGQGWFEAAENAALEGVPVRRGPLRISELTRGNLKAKNAVKIINQFEGNASLIYLREEGEIRAGDLVYEIDTKELKDYQESQDLEVKAAEAALIKSIKEYEIQEIQNQTDMDEAKLALALAKLDLAKFVDLEEIPENYDPALHDAPIEGEWAHELAQAEESIKMATLTLAQDEETHRWTKVLYDQGYAQRTELDRDMLSVEGSKIKLEQAQREFVLARKYGYQRKLAELQAEVQRRTRDILKVEKQAVARLADMESEREEDRYRLGREKERFADVIEQLAYGKMVAPIDGTLVYTRAKSRYGGGEVPQEGGSVHERQEIASIPREGGMTVEVSLHETKLDNVFAGQKAMVKVDAIPERVFEGQVIKVASVADSGSWMSNPNQRLYMTEITLNEAIPAMRPGMSCEVEILVEDMEDVLYVPRQSVHMDGRKTVCFVVEDGQVVVREVRTGADNSKWVVIEEGVAEGATVLLAPPASWEPSAVEESEDPFPGGKVDATPRKQRTASGEDQAEGAPVGVPTAEQAAKMKQEFDLLTPEEKEAKLEELRKMYGGGGSSPGGGRGDRGGGGRSGGSRSGGGPRGGGGGD